MRILLVLIMISFLKSDSIIIKAQIEIILKNKEIYFIETDSEFGMYHDNKEKEKSYNLLEFQIKNISEKKLLLFVNPNDLDFSSYGYYPQNKKYLEHGHLIQSDGKIANVTNLFLTFKDHPVGLDNKENYNYEQRKIKYKSIGLKHSEEKAYNLYEQYSFVLGPNETKTFYFSLTLPIIKEANDNIIQNPVSYEKLEEDWDFKIVYQSLADNIYMDLPNFIKEELHQNKVEIFNGTVYSNTVKLKRK